MPYSKSFIRNFISGFLLVFLLAFIALMASIPRKGTLHDGADRTDRSLDAVDEPVMSQLGNATIRAELGRATWTLLHTLAARFPEEPTEPEKDHARMFFTKLSIIYPCGQCAREFQKLLALHPMELDSRKQFISWLCKVHNIVNVRLEKPIFDCEKVEERWKCGCTEEI